MSGASGTGARGAGNAGGRIALAALVLLLALLIGARAAQPAASQPTASHPTGAADGAQPPQVQELLKLLAEPQVQAWLAEQRAGKPRAAAAANAVDGSASHYFAARVALVHEHLADLAATLPTMPDQLERASALVRADIGQRGRGPVLLHLILFIALGFGAEWLFRLATRGVRGRLDQHPVETIKDRLHLIAARFAFALGLIAAFTLGSAGPFFALRLGADSARDPASAIWSPSSSSG